MKPFPRYIVIDRWAPKPARRRRSTRDFGLLRAAIVCFVVAAGALCCLTGCEAVKQPTPDVTRVAVDRATLATATGQWIGQGDPLSHTKGHSMEPYIKTGDMIFGKRPDASTNWHVGQVVSLDERQASIVAAADRARICHMVYQVSDDRRYIYVGGTNHFTNLYPDGWYPVSKVNFVVVRILCRDDVAP